MDNRGRVLGISLEMLLDPRLLRPEPRQRIAAALGTGHLVVLQDALRPACAEAVHAQPPMTASPEVALVQPE
jgi:hypothetical protein